MIESMDRSMQILSVLLLLTLGSVVSAQTPLTCGIVGIDGPSEAELGTTLQFKVKITGMLHMTKPEFKWTVSAGTIISGQGTDQISVDTAGLGGQDVTTRVELSGATPGCNGSAFMTTEIEPERFVCGRPFDEFGDNIKSEDEEARLDNFAIQVSQIPLSIGYILMSAGQKTFENEAAEHLDRVKSYLVNVRGIDRNQLVTLHCGFTTDLTVKLYIFPPGSIIPTCDIFQQIPISEVKFTKPRPKASKKKR